MTTGYTGTGNLHLVTARNRRAAKRHAVRLDGELTVQGLPPRGCTVLDLGRRGMAVVARDQDSRGRRRPAVGSPVDIRLPLGDGGGRARARGVVRWAVDEERGWRCGLWFEQCNDTVFDLLLADGADLAPRLGASAGGEHGLEDFAPALPAWFPVFSGSFLPLLLERGQDLLLARAEEADDDATCSISAHAAIELWSARDRLHGTVRDSVAEMLLARSALMMRAPTLTVGMLRRALASACRQHFSEPLHVGTALSALDACVRASLDPTPPPPSRVRRNEIVLGGEAAPPPRGGPATDGGSRGDGEACRA